MKKISCVIKYSRNFAFYTGQRKSLIFLDLSLKAFVHLFLNLLFLGPVTEKKRDIWIVYYDHVFINVKIFSRNCRVMHGFFCTGKKKLKLFL